MNSLRFFVVSVFLAAATLGHANVDKNHGDCEGHLNGRLPTSAGPSLLKSTSKISFAQLETAALADINHGNGTAPYWLQEALPEGFSYLVTPTRQHASGRTQQELGNGFVLIRSRFDYNGVTYNPNVGVSPVTLAMNLERGENGEKKTLISDTARIAGIHTHGGGTNLSSAANGAGATVQLGKRNIEVVAVDFPSHGANHPENPTKRPMDYPELPLAFMQKFMFNPNKPVPLFSMGHSMGGQVNDIIQTTMSRSEIAQKFPNLPFKAVVMLSPPTDPTEGGTIFEKVYRDREFQDPSTQDTLLGNNNINLRAQPVMNALAYMQSWTTHTVNSDDMVPGLAIMGESDDVCMLGNEQYWYKHMAQRPNTKAIVYESSDMVDFNGDPIKADHIIPKCYRRGQFAQKGVGATMPAVYADIVNYLEQGVLGEKDFDVYSAAATDLSKIAPPAYIATYSTIVELYAKNLLFRKYFERKVFAKRTAKNPKLSSYLNEFLEGLSQFIADAARYRASLFNPQLKIEGAEDWSLFFDWMQNGSQELRSQAIALSDKWAEGSRPALKFASALLSHSLGKTNTTKYNDLPVWFPVRLDHLAEAIKNAPAITEGAKKPNVIEKLQDLNKVLVGFRDIKIKDLSAAFPELAQLSEQQESLQKRLNELTETRSRVLLPSLVQLHSQLAQLDRLIVKDSLESFEAKGRELEAAAANLGELSDLEAGNFDEALAKYSALLSDKIFDIEIKDEKTKNEGWKTQAFESYLGPEIRNSFSNLNKKLDLYKSLKPEDKKRAKTADEFVKLWNVASAQLIAFRETISGASSFTGVHSPELDVLEAAKERLFNEVKTTEDEFFDLLRDTIEKNQSQWSKDFQPSYPKRLFDLIAIFDAKQIEYQNAKQQLSAKQKAIAPKGTFGPYLKFVYGKIDLLTRQIAELNGSEADIGTKTQSLTAVEDELVEIDAQLNAIETYVVRNYEANLYDISPISALDVWNNRSEKPSLDFVNQILAGWWRIWRDPTGGAVQDSSAY